MTLSCTPSRYLFFADHVHLFVILPFYIFITNIFLPSELQSMFILYQIKIQKCQSAELTYFLLQSTVASRAGRDETNLAQATSAPPDADMSARVLREMVPVAIWPDILTLIPHRRESRTQPLLSPLSFILWISCRSSRDSSSKRCFSRMMHRTSDTPRQIRLVLPEPPASLSVFSFREIPLWPGQYIQLI